MSTSTEVNIPGYAAGTWVIDTAHSGVSFQARQFGIGKAHGTFDDFEGTIVTAENPLDSSVTAVIKTASVNTRNRRRDKHLRTDDFLSVEQYPTMTFTSTGVRVDGETFLLDGDLTIRTVTKQVTLTVVPNGFGADDKPLAGFTASTEIDRKDFGVTGGVSGAVVGAKITITLEIKASQQD
ncbi:YceI family protein [Actinophytocola sp.]|jgi:polyisoprenoid-binding protein YceI|uniref:YceI family protein n=1 Tax=Actinophytocola sp. TaxID=1872138 RepID=UPI002ED9376C